MEDLEIIFFLLLAAVLLVGVAQTINIPYPLILIFGGAALSFIPGLDNITFNPNLVLMIFLPPILYHSAFGISFREFQLSWKSIFSLALGLVAITTVVIALIFKWIFPELPWALAFAFGAIVSPPDAIAVTSILKRFEMNPRLITLLEGESLINDASAIVIYKIAISSLMAGSIHLSEGGYHLFYGVIGGVFIGFVLGLLFQLFSKYYLEPVLGVVFSITIPYVTYIIADNLEVSGVLAVVVNGLIGALILHSHDSPLRRVLSFAVWDIFIILVNCLVFILIGLQIRSIAEKMTSDQMIKYLGIAFIFFLSLIAVRMMFVYGRAAILYMKAMHQKNSSKMCPLILRLDFSIF